jgi:beta-lactam-binding protein with PASTA domain
MSRSAPIVLLAVVLAGCGGLPARNPPSTTPAQPTTAPVLTTPKATPEPPAAKTCTVPAVVGMVHQTAQDTMQANGLYVLREEDATGRGRLLINDRNWTTVGQTPAAGEVVDCTTTVTLTAKKIGE